MIFKRHLSAEFEFNEQELRKLRAEIDILITNDNIEDNPALLAFYQQITSVLEG